MMMHSSIEKLRIGGPIGRTAWIVTLTAISVLVLYTVERAVSGGFDSSYFPESLAVKVVLLPVTFPVHMVTGALALILVPLTLWLRPRRHWHRWVGRVAAADVLIAGVTAFPVAWVAPVTTLSALGFSAQAVTWLTLLGLGIYNIRNRRIAEHRACMLLMLAATSGAVFFRVWLALWAIYGTSRYYERFYAFDSWFAWGMPVAVTAWLLSRQPGGLKLAFRPRRA
jgi:hypothetical protein